MHIYFSAIGGVGIGPLAMLALDAGYHVSGSDLQESEMTKSLQQRGATLHIGQNSANVANIQQQRPIDWLVYSSALPDDHPELLFARQHGIKVSKRDEFLNHLIAEKDLRLIAVAGTHGKTTTTGMLVWLFQQLGEPISYSVGTNLSFGPAAKYQEGSAYFIYECDEFDRNFLAFKPYLSLIASVDYDHPDTYPTRDDYKSAFQTFITKSAHTILWKTSADYLSLSPGPSIDVLVETDLPLAQLSLPGSHTRHNAWLAYQTIKRLMPSANKEATLQALNSFPGTQRRFENLTENLYTDYAHHPVEITATIQMAQEVNNNVVVVYQPHQNIRQHEIMNEGGYKTAFDGAKKVYWLPTYLSREYQDLEVLSPKALVASLSSPPQAEVATLDEALLENIEKHRKNGDLVIAMSAGDLDPWLRKNIHG